MDGVLNDQDTCPDTPEDQLVDITGCSGTQLDDDNDGVSNDSDQCPDEDSSNFDNNRDGCIDDSDSDGINDVEDACPMIGDNVDATGCPESQIREEYEVEEITGLHYSIEMYNLTHGVMEEERFLNTNDSNYIRYQLWRLVEIYNAHNTYNANINSIIEAYILERDSTDDWVNHYDYKLQIDDNLTILDLSLIHI